MCAYYLAVAVLGFSFPDSVRISALIRGAMVIEWRSGGV